VLGQRAVAAKSNEISAVPLLLAGRDLRGSVTTMDALLTQRSLARQIPDQHGHYLMVVKGNQPEL
jgi:predicted transposase YbfD/YdcC